MDNTKPLSAQILDLRPHGLRDRHIKAIAQAVLELETRVTKLQAVADAAERWHDSGGHDADHDAVDGALILAIEANLPKYA